MIHAIVCGYNCGQTIDKCLDSIRAQNFSRQKLSVAIETIADRKYLVENTWDTINSMALDPDDIIVLIDADDFLTDEDSFKIVSDEYKNNPNLLLTYGSYVNLSTQKRGKFTGEYGPGESFRTSPWRASHLKTFKYKLWKRLPESALKHDNGEWFTCCADRAIMTPLMEMAGHDRIKYLDWILYCYNDTNKQSVWNTQKANSIMTREEIYSRTPFNRIEKI